MRRKFIPQRFGKDDTLKVSNTSFENNAILKNKNAKISSRPPNTNILIPLGGSK